jgi:hypothetical protein
MPPFAAKPTNGVFSCGIRSCAAARGDGQTMMGSDGLLITLPKGSDKIKTQNLL